MKRKTIKKWLICMLFLMGIIITEINVIPMQNVFAKDNKQDIEYGIEMSGNLSVFNFEQTVYAVDTSIAYTTGSSETGTWIRESNGKWWYRHADGSYTKNAWEYINGKWYHFDKYGWMQTGWLSLNGKWYYLTDDGDMVTGWQKINGKWYYFNNDGSMQTGWIRLDGKWYYLTANGDMAMGWQKINGKWYYFNNDGSMRTGWIRLDGKWYYLTANGDMATGWQKISDKWYYLNDDGAMQTGWYNWKADTYYLKNNGAMAVGWTEIDSLWYYFDNSGAMCRNQWIGKYYVNLYGEWVENTEITFDKAVVKIDIGYYEGVPANSQKASTDDSEIISQLVAYLSELKVTNRNIEEKTGGSCYTVTVYYIDGTSNKFDIVKDDSVLWHEGVPYDVDVQQIEAVWENISKY